MKRLITMVILLSIPALSGRLYGQGLYLTDGKSGVAATVDATTQNGTTGLGGTVGYSLGNFFDLRFSAGHYRLGEQLDGQNITANQYTPSMSLYGSGGSPICAMVRVSYAMTRFSSAALNTLKGTLDGNSASISFSIYTNISASPQVALYPSIGLEYIEGTHNDDIGFYPSVSSSFTRTPFTIGFPLSYLLASGMMLVVEPEFRLFPQLATDPSFSEFKLSAGIVLPTGFPF